MTKLRKSKKRRGFKDPYKQINQKFAKVKHLVNKPPRNADVQEIPKKWLRIQQNAKKIKEKEEKKKLGIADYGESSTKQKRPVGLETEEDLKNRNKTKKDKKKGKLLSTADFMSTGYYPKNCRPLKPIPTVTQRPKESLKSFIRRSCQVTNAVIKEAQMSDKFKVDIMRDETGHISDMVPFNKIPEMMSVKDQKLEEKRLQRKLEKKQKLKEKKMEKQRIAQEDKESEQKFFKYEKVQFGDVVSAPPTLQSAERLKIKKPKFKSQEQKQAERLRKEAVESYRKLKATKLWKKDN